MQSVTTPDCNETGGTRFRARAEHRQWLLSQADSLLGFFRTGALNPAGGFYQLDASGRPLKPKPGHNGTERQLHDTSRMVHSFAVSKLMGRPGANTFIDHGMDFLWKRHRDNKNGGYFWGVDDDRPTSPEKQAYGHAFVLLAASSAKVVGHPDADRLLADVTEVLYTRFWEPAVGATSEEFAADWRTISDYRGQNSNMHLAEALMAAFEATGEQTYLDGAQSIAELIINRHARAQGWRVAEHFDANWNVDSKYVGDPVFRPKGTTPGHALEWSRLLVQLWELGERKTDWLPNAAKHLFSNAVKTGWNTGSGGFYYTLDWDNVPDQTDRFWWPCAEGIAASAVLASVDENPLFEEWYRRIWQFVDAHVIDRKLGGWHPELNDQLEPISRVFEGRPDIYHALQSCIIPLLPPTGSITRGLISMRKEAGSGVL